MTTTAEQAREYEAAALRDLAERLGPGEAEKQFRAQLVRLDRERDAIIRDLVIR